MLNELGADALLLLNESNMHYFCGFSPSEGAILIFKNGEGAHIVDSRYTEAAENHAKETGLRVYEITSKFTDTVKELCSKAGVKAIAFEDETITLKSYGAYKAATGCDFIEIGNRLMKIRNVKDEKELEYMVNANAIAEKALKSFKTTSSPARRKRNCRHFLII